VEEFERLEGTSGGDRLCFTVVGRRVRTVPLGDLRVGAFEFVVPGLTGFEVNHGEHRDRFVFPFAQDVGYRLDAAPGVRADLREVSTLPSLENRICVSRETRGDGELFARTFALKRRTVTGEALDDLAATVEQIEAMTRVVVTLAGSPGLSGTGSG
jgi:hypothetical protein